VLSVVVVVVVVVVVAVMSYVGHRMVKIYRADTKYG
jgi:hypothetical protein